METLEAVTPEVKPETESQEVKPEEVKKVEVKQEKVASLPKTLVESRNKFYVYKVGDGYIIENEMAVRLTPVMQSYDEAIDMLKGLTRHF